MAYADLDSIFTPGAGVAVTTTVWNQLHDNLDYLYERGPYICTNATRPGSPFNGQWIYETDTQRDFQYSSSAWRLVGGLGAPRCRVRRTSSQSFTTGTPAAVSFTGSDIYDEGAMHDPSTNPSRITIPTGCGGQYSIGASVKLSSATTWDLYVKINGGANSYAQIQGTGSRLSIHSEYPMSAGDYFEIFVVQVSGGSLNADAESLNSPVAWCSWTRP